MKSAEYYEAQDSRECPYWDDPEYIPTTEQINQMHTDCRVGLTGREYLNFLRFYNEAQGYGDWDACRDWAELARQNLKEGKE